LRKIASFLSPRISGWDAECQTPMRFRTALLLCSTESLPVFIVRRPSGSGPLSRLLASADPDLAPGVRLWQALLARMESP
jgi:hypothetical protein